MLQPQQWQADERFRWYDNSVEMQWFGLTAHIKSEESLTRATQKVLDVSCVFGAHVQSAVWVPVLLAEAQTCRNGFSFLKDGTLSFFYASLTMAHSTRLCKPSLWTSSTFSTSARSFSSPSMPRTHYCSLLLQSANAGEIFMLQANPSGRV